MQATAEARCPAAECPVEIVRLWRLKWTSTFGRQVNTYESPSIIELGSVESLTNASGNERDFDSNLPGFISLIGFAGNGGTYGS